MGITFLSRPISLSKGEHMSKSKISVGDLVHHPDLGLCVVKKIKEDGTADISMLWQKGDVLVDENNNPVGIVEIDDGDTPDGRGGYIHHATTTVPVAIGTLVRNLSLEQREAVNNQRKAEHDQKKANAALAELGL